MTPQPIPIPCVAELPEWPCVFYTCYTSHIKAAMEFTDHYHEDPRAIYEVKNPLTGHTTFCIPRASSDKRTIIIDG